MLSIMPFRPIYISFNNSLGRVGFSVSPKGWQACLTEGNGIRVVHHDLLRSWSLARSPVAVAISLQCACTLHANALLILFLALFSALVVVHRECRQRGKESKRLRNAMGIEMRDCCSKEQQIRNTKYGIYCHVSCFEFILAAASKVAGAGGEGLG